MSNHDQTPRNSNSSAPEQVPHSGVHGYERPVDEFDNTTLAEAHEQGLLTTPDTAARLAGEAQVDTQTTTVPPRQVGERRNTKESLPWYKKKVVKIAGAVMGLVGAGAAVVATQGGENNTVAPTPERTTSAPADGETSVDNEAPGEITVQPLSAETLTTPDQVVQGYHALRNEWINVGSTPETVELIRNNPVKSTREHAATIAAQYEEKYANALFTSEALTDPFTQELIRGLTETQVSVIDVYSVTIDDLEPYKRWTEITSIDILSSDATSFTANVYFTNKDNISKNNGEAFVKSAEGIEGSYTVSFILIGNTWKINNIAKL